MLRGCFGGSSRRRIDDGEIDLRVDGELLAQRRHPGPGLGLGLRLGTPALTTLGMGAAEVEEIAEVRTNVLRATTPVVTDGKSSKAKYVTEQQAGAEARARMATLCQEFPVYPEIDLSIIDPAA